MDMKSRQDLGQLERQWQSPGLSPGSVVCMSTSSLLCSPPTIPQIPLTQEEAAALP